MLQKPFFLLCLLSLVVHGSGAQVVVQQGPAGGGQTAQPNTWSATSNTGLTLMGTWTAVPEPGNETVIGTWTLVDAQGRILSGGGWSAAKSPTRWSGPWRANVSGHSAEFGGTWSASADLKGSAAFAELFEKAVQTIVGGSWQAGRYSGAWSIRAFK